MCEHVHPSKYCTAVLLGYVYLYIPPPVVRINMVPYIITTREISSSCGNVAKTNHISLPQVYHILVNFASLDLNLLYNKIIKFSNLCRFTVKGTVQHDGFGRK